MMNLFEVSKEISDRLTRVFLRDPSAGPGQTGRRPVYGGTRKFQDDPHWRDYLLFYEYFHGDNGAGLGGEATRRAGPARWPRSSTSSAFSPPGECWRWARRPRSGLAPRRR
jgi:hypothetical protein